MVETTEGKRINELRILLIIIVILIIVISTYINFKVDNLKEQVNQEGLYDYCVEYDGWIERNNMIFNCYDFEKQKFKCYFDDGDNILLVDKDLDGYLEDEYYCSRYVKSTRVVNVKKGILNKTEGGKKNGSN